LSSSDKDKIVIKQQTTVTDKVKHRLEDLNDFEEVTVKLYHMVLFLKISIPLPWQVFLV